MKLCFLKNIKSVISGIFLHKFFAAVKEVHKYILPSTTSLDTKFLLPWHSEELKKEHYWGSADYFEVDLGSGVNCLASCNLRQFTTIPSHCG